MDISSPLLLFAALLAAAVTWIAVARAHYALETIAKPATLLLLIGWLAAQVSLRPTAPGLVFLGGLVAALAGDILLLRPRRRLAAGMGAFIVALAAYAVALALSGLPRTLPALGLALAVGTVGVLGFGFVSRRARWHKRPWLRPAARVYTACLALMLWSALVTPLRPGWSGIEALAVLVGGALFAGSDAVLGWVELVRPSRRKLVLVMVTYHLGQIALVWGFAGQL